MTGRTRFWKAVSVREEDGVFLPCLDDRPIRLPQGARLALRSRALADAIAGEWAAIGEGAAFTPDALPLTRMAGTMIERIVPDESSARERLLAFGVDDALCYCHASTDAAGGGEASTDLPGSGVVEAVFEWLSGYGISPIVTDGLIPVTQTDAYMAGLRSLLSEADALALEAAGVFAQATGSLLLSLALVHGVVAPLDAAVWANREEQQQLRTWGQDDDLIRAMEVRERDILDAGLFLRLGRDIMPGPRR